MKIAFVFSGQGAQYLGMGQELSKYSDKFKSKLSEANNSLDFDLFQLLFEDEKKLNATEFTQPAILAVSLAISELIKTELGIQPDVVAGLSLGEYSALVENQMLDFQTAVGLVQKRGRFMTEAVPENDGAMAAVLGLECTIVQTICSKVSCEENLVAPANYNCPGQIVIAGNKEAVVQACSILKEAGAKRAILLNVSGPFHTPLLKKASEKLAIELEKIDFHQAVLPIYSNVTGRKMEQGQNVKELLVEQVMSPVYWEDLVQQMMDDGVDTFIEVGPGRILSGFIKKINRKVTIFNVEDLKSLEKLKSKWQELGEKNA
ncbi:ACP S-malonyltransferase [Vagococcus sp.]|uniref:ACP S-malonyltransferase n=1 Tax=Vagococcus sp. TaxID=1933889 RepID=UPI003F9543E0